MESQNQHNQPIEIGSVLHISEEEFHSIKEEPQARSETFQLALPPMPDLIPLADLSWVVLEELHSLLECPVCTHQISHLPVHCCPRGHVLCSPCWDHCPVCPVCQGGSQQISGIAFYLEKIREFRKIRFDIMRYEIFLQFPSHSDVQCFSVVSGKVSCVKCS